MALYPRYTHPSECTCPYCGLDKEWAASPYGPSRRTTHVRRVGNVRDGNWRFRYTSDNTIDTRPCAECKVLPCTCDAPKEATP